MGRGPAVTRRHAVSERGLVALAAAVLLAVLAVRMTGPWDLYDQAQPRTIAATVDMLVHDRWLLPREGDEHALTKPPLVNWLAAPLVTVLGSGSVVAHKAPGLVAALLAWLLLLRLPRRIDPVHGAAWGAMAGIAFIANAMLFKLAWLARPDMVLAATMIAGWACATALLHGNEPPRRAGVLRAGFWICVALALLAKGPPALLLLLHALLAAKWPGGSWRRARRMGWGWGPLAVLPFAAWVFAVWRIDPGHLVDQLWSREVAGRLTGTGEGTGGRGPIDGLRRVLHMPVYLVLRFAPWSAVLAFALLRPRARGGVASAPPATARGHWCRSAALLVIVTVAVFSISVGKRADYLAPAFGPAALLVGAWLTAGLDERRLRRATIAVALLAAVTIIALGVVDRRRPEAPVRDFGPAMASFIESAQGEIAADPAPMAWWRTGRSPLQALLGHSARERPDDTRAALAGIRDAPGGRMWVLAGEAPDREGHFLRWLGAAEQRDAAGGPLAAREVARSAVLPQEHGWPGRVILYEVRAEGEFNPDGR